VTGAEYSRPIFFPKRSFQWDTSNSFLKKDGNTEYSFVTVAGIKCRRILHPNGTVLIHGEDTDKGVQIMKLESSPNIWKKEIFHGNTPLHGKTRNRYLIDAEGRETLVEKCLYNEHGVLVRHLDDGKWFTYSPNKDEAKDAATGAIVWMKKKDAKGRVIEYLSGAQTYLFNYRDKDVEVSVLDKDKHLLKKLAVSHGDVIKLFPRN